MRVPPEQGNSFYLVRVRNEVKVVRTIGDMNNRKTDGTVDHPTKRETSARVETLQ
jgi:hypothetical protein